MFQGRVSLYSVRSGDWPFVQLQLNCKVFSSQELAPSETQNLPQALLWALHQPTRSPSGTRPGLARVKGLVEFPCADTRVTAERTTAATVRVNIFAGGEAVSSG